jgi:glycosyltransferase involved in cell wall biosynthesis
MDIAVILPAYNEELTIEQVIEDFYTHLPEATIVVIDNNSKDKTAEITRATFQRLNCAGVLLSEKKQGKSFAVRRAFTEIDADVYLMVDADMTYPAEYARSLIEKVASGDADMAVGDRHALGHYKSENKRAFHNFGNTLIRVLVNSLFKSRLNDILSGYRAFSHKFVKSYPILSKGFTIETEMSLHALDKNFKIVEMPIVYKDRPTGSVSKLRTYSDGARALLLIFDIFRTYRPLQFFSSVAGVFALSGILAGAPVLIEYFTKGFILHLPFAILATGLMLLSMISFAIGVILDTVAANNRFLYELHLLRLQSRDVSSEQSGRRAANR